MQRDQVILSVIAMALLSWAAALHGAVISEVLWQEDFDSFELGDPTLQDTTWTKSLNPVPDSVLIRYDPVEDVSECRYIIDGVDVPCFLRWNNNPERPSSDPYAEYNPNDFYEGNNRLVVVKRDPVGLNVMGYAVKDISGLDINPKADVLVLEFDLYPNFHWPHPDFMEASQVQINFATEAGNVFAWMTLRGYPYGNEFVLNNVTIPGPLWRYWAFNRYKLEVDFLRDKVSLYIDSETEPRQVAALAGDYDISMAAQIRFGAGVYYWKYARGHCLVDNLVLSQQYLCPPGDVVRDCTVNMLDLAQVANDWLMDSRLY